MASVTRIPRPLHPWKIKHIPSLAVEQGTKLFFLGRAPAIIRHHPAFAVRAKPIQPLTAQPPPHLKGPKILQAFLYARKHWPNYPLRSVLSDAMEAIYESRRVDGLPRVIFSVSKEVATPLRGKLQAALRHRFKRVGRTAFKVALETLRRENHGIPILRFLTKNIDVIWI
jgi:RNase P protein component